MDENNIQNQTVLRRPVRPIPQYQEEKIERIKIWMGAALIITAISIDLFEMLLEWLGIGIFGLSTLLSVCATIIFWVWFKILGVSFGASPKKFATMMATSILEIIPGLDSLGGFIWTIGIIALVIITRSEDKGGLIGKAADFIPSKKIGK